MRRQHPALPVAAFTLVEVLLSLTLLSVVLAAAMRLVRQNVMVEQSMRAADTQHLAEDAVFDCLQRDLDGLVAQEGSISVSDGLLLELHAVTRFDDAEARQSALLPARVCYGLEKHGEAHWLIHAQRDLTAEQPTEQRLVLMRDVETAVLSVHDGKEWRPLVELPLHTVPAALKLVLQRASGAKSARVYLLRASEQRADRSQRVH